MVKTCSTLLYARHLLPYSLIWLCLCNKISHHHTNTQIQMYTYIIQYIQTNNGNTQKEMFVTVSHSFWDNYFNDRDKIHTIILYIIYFSFCVFVTVTFCRPCPPPFPLPATYSSVNLPSYPPTAPSTSPYPTHAHTI